MGQPRRSPPWVFANLAEGAPTGVKALPVKAIAPGASVPISKWDGRQGYDRYEYLRKKREAFDRLAALVERVVNPPEGSNVVPIPVRR